MAPSSSIGCLGGVAAVTAATAGLLEVAGRGILSILDRRAVKCLECGNKKQPESMQKHMDKHRDAEKTEQEKAALKAEYDQKLTDQRREMEEQMRKDREDMRNHLVAVLEYKSHCERDWNERKAREMEARELISNEEDKRKARERDTAWSSECLEAAMNMQRNASGGNARMLNELNKKSSFIRNYS